MHEHLTAYLLHYKTVNVPGFGRLQVVQQPAHLNVADRVIEPPSYNVDVLPEDEISAHQLAYLQAQSGLPETELRSRLQGFGRRVREEGFVWEGFGVINANASSFPLALPSLQSLPAEKIIRQDATHKMLVGDRHVTATELADEQRAGLRKRRLSTPVLIAWLLLVLAVLFIAVLLVLGKFNVNAAGSKLPVAAIPFAKPANASLL